MPQRRARRRSYLFEFASKGGGKSSIPCRLSVLLCACRRGCRPRLFDSFSPARKCDRHAFGDRLLAMLAQGLARRELSKRDRGMEIHRHRNSAEPGDMP